MKWELVLETDPNDPGFQELLYLQEQLDSVSKKTRLHISKIIIQYIRRFFEALKQINYGC